MTDGVSDVMNEREIVNFVSDYEDPKKASEELVQNALSISPSRDNSTAIVVFL